MDIFEYFDEEHADIEAKLKEVTENYNSWTREQVFDRVKLICDAIMGHLKKQQNLLLDNLTPSAQLTSLMQDCQKDRFKVEEEIGQLVMVHVDEPAYQEYLSHLLKVIEEHIAFSRGFYQKLRSFAQKSDLNDVNSKLKDMVLHSADYNAIQP